MKEREVRFLFLIKIKFYTFSNWWYHYLVRVDLLGRAHVLVRNLADSHTPRLQYLQHLIRLGCLCHGGDVKNDPVRHFLFLWLLLCLEIWRQMTLGSRCRCLYRWLTWGGFEPKIWILMTMRCRTWGWASPPPRICPLDPHWRLERKRAKSGHVSLPGNTRH